MVHSADVDNFCNSYRTKVDGVMTYFGNMLS